MPIHGSIEEAGLPDVLQLLSLGRKSGCLSVSDGTSKGEIFLDVGRISFASLANRDRLGEMLVRHGRITRDQLTQATAEQARGSDRQLGRILMSFGSIDRGDIEKFVRMQVEETIYILFTWKQGTFTFSSDQTPSRGALLVSLDAESLLLEGARRVDEWSLIERKVPSFDLVYVRAKQKRVSGGSGTTAPSDDLTEDQRRILPLLDGTRDMNAVAELAGMGDFDTGKALYGLIVAGFARLVERRAQVRHLDYRELLAYVVREAELADPQRRKLVARHIVDCPTCSERLRTIHVRRTEGKGVPMPTEEEIAAVGASHAVTVPTPAVTPATPAAAAPEAEPEVDFFASHTGPDERVSMIAAPMPILPEELQLALVPPAAAAAPAPAPAPPVTAAPPAAPAPPAIAPRPEPRTTLGATRDEEERRARERRARDRRAGRERRHVDRRAGLDRRQLPVQAAAQAAGERRMGGRRESDREATVGIGHDRRSADRVRGEEAPALAQHPQLRATEGRRLPNLGGMAAAASAAAIVPEAVAPAAPPAARPSPSAPGERSTKDLVWLMSPDESIELIRASRTDMRVPSGAEAAPAAQRTTTAAPRRQVIDSVRPSPITSAASPAPDDADDGPALLRSGASAISVPAPRPPRVPTPQAVVAIPIRSLVTAAALIGIAGAAYLIGKSGSSAGPELPRQTAAVLADPPAATGVSTAQATEPPVARNVPAPETRTPVTQPLPQPAGRTTPQPVRGTPQPGQANPAVQRATPDPVQPQPVATVVPPPAPPPAPVVTAPPPAAAPTPAAAASAPPAPAPTASEPDRELATGGWATVDRAEAATLMGGGFGAIQGLSIESMARSVTGSRARLRVTQITPAGERIVLTETRSGAGRSGPAVVTAVRVLPPSEAYPFSTGTVSLGNLLVTAKSSMTADALRALLERLAEAQ